MQIKDGVIMAGLDINMRPVLLHAEDIWDRFGEELVVTGALDGTHSAGSLHYYGRALDFRTRYFGKEEALAVANTLRDTLDQLYPDTYDVIAHGTHIHVEYDPK